MDIPNIIKKFVNELKKIYGANLKYVLLYGSYACGQAEEESDIDLLVVLDHFKNFWEELSKIENLAYNVTFGSGNKLVLSAFPITQARYRQGKSPFILNVKKEKKIIK